MGHGSSQDRSLAPTLGTIVELFWKAEREHYRTWHARNAVHKADHFFNFCVTTHALRDYYLETAPDAPFTAAAKNKLHQEWNRVDVICAVKDIANTAKHWQLKAPPSTKEVRLRDNSAADIYLSDGGKIVTQEVIVPAWTVEVHKGRDYDTWHFLETVLEYWRGFLVTKGITIPHQPRSLFFGEDETRTVHCEVD